MMIYSTLAAAFVAVSHAQLADNVALHGAAKCNNYIRMEYDELYPVGRCYSENTDETQIVSSGVSMYTQNMMFTCTATGNDTTEACLYRYGAGCNGLINDEEICYPCNGAEDECECEVGGDASECDLYEETSYETQFSFSGYYCDKKTSALERQVVNMCIQGSNSAIGSEFTYAYECGGYDDRSGNDQAYVNEYDYHTTADCSGTEAAVPTSYPTEMTDAPTPSPTLEAGVDDWSFPYCSESTCAGVDSPRADGVERNSVVVAMAFAVFASLMG